MAMIFSLSHLSCGYQKKPVLSDLSFSVSEGEILCILGPNGVGKTTLFKTMLGLLPPIAGAVYIDDKDITGLPARKKAQYLGYIPQSHTPPFPYTVQQVVVMGRTAHLNLSAAPSRQDYALAEQAMENLGILGLKDKIYTRISGGERQMVLIARALTQNPKILLMDEPAANLDFGNQARVLQEISELARMGMTIVMTTHTPDHAFLCSSKVALLEKGGRVSFGTADEIITEENMKRAYGVQVCMTHATKNNKDIKGCVPLINTKM